MAAGLGFKTFTTGEVLTAADTNGYLMQGVLVFASSAARAAAITSPQEGQYSYLKDTNSTEYYNGAAWTTPGGGGKVLQVVTGTTSSTASNSTNTYADTNLTASITPSAATSKVLVMVAQQDVTKSDANSGNRIIFRLMRGATELMDGRTHATFSALYLQASWSTVWLDSPSTTSATTYKTQFLNAANTASVSCQSNGDNESSIILIEIGA